MPIERDQILLLRRILQSYIIEFNDRYKRLLSPAVHGFFPTPLKAYLAELHEALKSLQRLPEQQREIDERFAPVIRHAVIAERLAVANRVEQRRSRTIHPEMLEQLDAELVPYAALLAADWLQLAAPRPIPQLTEFIPVEFAEADLAKELGPERPREYDEKFRILQAPGLFLYDLDRARKAAALRGISVATAYVDIDHFKAFNTERGEPFVDRNVLPRFMRFIEAHVYTRGRAYRYGGDEYCILLDNVTEEEALASMDRLREGLGALTYEGTDRRTTVSIGVVLVRPDCHLTGTEIEQAAARAKSFAKDSGRDRVASYATPFFRDVDLRVTTAG